VSRGGAGVDTAGDAPRHGRRLNPRTPDIATLAFIVYAIRRRDPRWLMAAGAGVVVCILTSLDHGAYAMLTLLIAALRFTTIANER